MESLPPGPTHHLFPQTLGFGRPFGTGRVQTRPSFGVRSKKTGNITLNVIARHATTVLRQETIGIGEAYTHSSYWFSWLRTLTRKRLLGNSRHKFSRTRMFDRPTASPTKRNAGLTCLRTPIMSETGIRSSRQAGSTPGGPVRARTLSWPSWT